MGKEPHRGDVQQAVELVDQIWSDVEFDAQFISAGYSNSVFHRILDIVVDLTESEFGFIGYVSADPNGSPFLTTLGITDISWDESSTRLYLENSPSGMEFRNLDTLFGAVMQTARMVVSNNPDSDPRSGGLPHGHPKLSSFAGIPLISNKKLVGMIGIANRPDGFSYPVLQGLGEVWNRLAYIIHAVKESALRRKAISTHITDESMLEAIFDNASDSILIVDSSLNVVKINRSARRLFDLEEDDLSSTNLVHLVVSRSGNLKHEIEKAGSNIDGSGLPFVDERFTGVDGRELIASVAKTNSVQEGEPIYTIFLAEMSAFEAIAKSKIDELHFITESSPNPIFLIDNESIVVGWNPAMAKLSGIGAYRAIGNSIQSLLGREFNSSLNESINNPAAHDLPTRYDLDIIYSQDDLVFTNSNGDVKVMNITPVPRFDFEGRRDGHYVAGREVTNQYFYHQENRKLALERESLINRLMRAQETERVKLAADLHDGPAQDLAAALMFLEKCSQFELPGGLVDISTKTRDSIDRTLSEIRHIINGLSPESLNTLGLVGALKSLAYRVVQESDLVLTLDISEDIDQLSSVNRQVAIYRIVQEAMRNTIKHANASEIKIKASLSDTMMFRLVYEDDGIGIANSKEDSQIPYHNGLGMSGMRHRADSIDAKFSIGTSGNGEKHGFRLTLEFDASTWNDFYSGLADG
ncbi:GAF domain-containing protein [SAR202 cluster bacterium JH702]|uniref:histidine kinase n=1 Tax=Candidatus Lucifugimonas marina TaxID=3038979 RepID=A0ABD4XU58_9CHLR|nr:GAF domain-containing protein [SAR202 cluster bacterium JH702]